MPFAFNRCAYHPGPPKFAPSSSITYKLLSMPHVHQCMSVPVPGYFDGSISHTRRLINLLCGYLISLCSVWPLILGAKAEKNKTRGITNLDTFIKLLLLMTTN